MHRNTNDDGATSYTLTRTEKAVILGAVAYILGYRYGFRVGRLSMTNEIEKIGATQA